MSEYKYLIDGMRLEYEGYFDLKGLFRQIEQFFQERGYDADETKNFEEVYSTGKQITIEMYPYKKPSDYYKMEVRLFIVFKRVTEEKVELDGVMKNVNKGQIEALFDATLISDFEELWEDRPIFYFIRTLSDKYLRKNKTAMAEALLVQDTKDVIELIKAYLNMNRFGFKPGSGNRHVPDEI